MDNSSVRGGGPGAVIGCAFVAFILVVAGCKGTDTIVCQPDCPGGSHCEASGCVPDSPNGSIDMSAGDLATSCTPACTGSTYCNGNHQCVPCLTDQHCPIGEICKQAGASSACVAGCTDDSRCEGGGARDGGTSAPKCCAGQCADTRQDALNCGACGNACTLPHASAVCASGACARKECEPGWGDCNKIAEDGCETNLHTDVANCGGCGTACSFPNAVAGCADGCYIASCKFGWDDCNNDKDNKDGCEKDVSSDPKNCGACGKQCGKPAHAGVVCSNSACQLTGCDQGYSDCNGDSKDGCEVATGTDAANCGVCGNKCAQGLVCINSSCTCPMCNFPHAKSSCQNNQCVMGDCLPGYADCNMNPMDGCEVNINLDKKNCGSCGMVCPMNLPGCNMGNCAMGCLNGMQPPPPCTTGVDPENMVSYVVCTSDCNTAWLSANQQGGGKYHALQICQSYGYTQLGMTGGTCGTVCGRCTQGTSCMMPQMNPMFDGGGKACGMDMFGPVLCNTVHWTCLR